MWLISPRIDIKIETFAYDFLINTDIPSKYFNRRRVEISKKADDFDTLFWNMNKVVELTKEEIYAYDAIVRARENPDSAMTEGFFGTYFAPINRQLVKLSQPPFTGWQDIFEYNRIHGAYLGIGVRGDFSDYNEAYTKMGYGFADNRPYGSILIKQFFEEERMFALTGESFFNLKRIDSPYGVRNETITLTSLLFNNDYGDYYYAQGFKIGFEAGIGQLRFIRRNVFDRPKTIKLYVLNERQREARVNTEFSLLNPNRLFRPNPSIIEGNETSLGFEINYNISPERRLADFGIRLEGIISSPSILSSDFKYQRFLATMIIRTKTLPLWRLDMRVSASFSNGNTPPQRFFSLESAVSGISGLNSFRGLNVKEFYGDRVASVSIEHNFGEIIPGVLRIPNVASFGIEFILYGNVGYTEFSNNALFSPKDETYYHEKQTSTTKDKFYYEFGVGINQILIFLRLDASVRLSQTDVPIFAVTIGSASF